MRVLIDTNVLISAALDAGSASFQAYAKASSPPNQGLVCGQNVEEMLRVFKTKFPHRVGTLARFLFGTRAALELVPVPSERNAAEELLRDASDRPILRAAMAANADVILTGDRDFLESGLPNPLIMTPAQFLQYG